MTKESRDIIDILETPDVAVWAKAISRKGTDSPSDKVKEPSRTTSITLHIKKHPKTGEATEMGDEEKHISAGRMVDPANKAEVERVAQDKDISLTDVAEYGKQGQ
jgi:hypothetical protein